MLGLDYVDSFAVGMQSIEEVGANTEYTETGKFTELSAKNRGLHIEGWCGGCGKCVERCGQNALSVRDNRAICDGKRCILCGYCSAVCDMWAIKVV
jgi:heterodisulfide reductase subunit A-like polyferredoxin